MDALFFFDFTAEHATGYDYRGAYQGRIAPSGNPSGGYHVLVVVTGRQETTLGWFPAMEDAKHGLVLAYGGAN